MSLSNIGPTWSWQFLPVPATMKEIRNAGRCLKRWGPVHGFKTGTSDADKARVLAARFIHLFCAPRTAAGEDFRDEEGIAKPEGYTNPGAKIGQPFNLPFLLPLFKSALAGALAMQAPGFPLSALDPLLNLNRYLVGPPNILALRVGPIFRAFCTVSPDLDPDADSRQTYLDLINALEWPLETYLPLIADKPWKIASMWGGSTVDESDWNASPWGVQYMTA